MSGGECHVKVKDGHTLKECSKQTTRMLQGIKDEQHQKVARSGLKDYFSSQEDSFYSNYCCRLLLRSNMPVNKAASFWDFCEPVEVADSNDLLSQTVVTCMNDHGNPQMKNRWCIEHEHLRSPSHAIESHNSLVVGDIGNWGLQANVHWRMSAYILVPIFAEGVHNWCQTAGIFLGPSAHPTPKPKQWQEAQYP
eukprot:763796-Amphidinium_carterae.1